MTSIKIINDNTIKIDSVKYKGYMIGDLPNRFGYIYNEHSDTHGISSWFNYKGLTYIQQ